MSQDYRKDWTPSPGPPRPGRSAYRRLINRVLILGTFLICLVILGAAVVGGLRLVEARSDGGATTTVAGGMVTVDIPSGMGATQVGRLLQENGVIESSGAFVDLVKARGSEDKLRPGIYTLPRGEELILVVEKLEQGAGLPGEKFTIPEGLAITQTGALLDRGDDIEGKDYIELAEQPEKFTLPPVGGSTPEVETLEGLLFPSTYYLSTGDDAEDLIRMQLSTFASTTKDLPWEKARGLGVTPYQIVIIASLIEKEANVADERSKVAAVIYNRLAKDMSLGIDATVRYALNKWTGPLTVSDLEVDSPFNTRVKKGLPPAPIASPGVAALRAALEPETVDYLYYVLIDTDGNHFFTSSYDEFVNAKRQSPGQ